MTAGSGCSVCGGVQAAVRMAVRQSRALSYILRSSSLFCLTCRILQCMSACYLPTIGGHVHVKISDAESTLTGRGLL